MNALAACYGYVSDPWVNFDLPSVNINYFRPGAVLQFLDALTERPLANTVKSHHPAEFFAAGAVAAATAPADASAATIAQAMIRANIRRRRIKRPRSPAGRRAGIPLAAS